MVITYVSPRGALNAKYVLVGEQPGKYEIRQGEPFVGPAGKNIQECCYNANLPWNQTYRTNVIKDLDRSIDHYIALPTTKKGLPIVSEDGEAYIEALKYELSLTTANVIIACGNIALYALCSRVGITNWRGSVIESTLLPGRKVIPTIHPAVWTQEKLYRNPSAYLSKYLVTFDLKRAVEQADYPEIRPSGVKIITRPSYLDCLNYISSCIEHGLSGAVIDYDIETMPYNNELACIGLAYGGHESICIPFVGPNGDYFTIDQEVEIMSLLDQLFGNPKIVKRGQNVIFDSHFLLKRYGIRTYSLQDTMVAQGIYMPEFKKGLDLITSIWTDFPYYKQDGKIWIDGSQNEWDRGWRYNALDVLSCATAHPKQEEALRLQGNLRTYERQVKLIPPLTYMMEHGIKVDVVGMQRAAERCKEEADKLTEEIQRHIGKEINIASPQQLVEYFYGTLGIEPYLSQDTQRPTVDVIALKRIANQGYPVATQILRVRQLQKKASTFLDVRQIDPDGRIRCSYNPVGTKFGRISSSQNIFGTGTNLQNQPHDVLTYFVADDGYIGYSIDMSQIENRIVAYVGNIEEMIRVFEEGLDMHRMTAALVLRNLGINRDYKDVTSTERQNYGKRPNHAFNYRFGANSFSLKYEVPLAIARRIYRAYHLAYPGLAAGYWKYVEGQIKEERRLVNLLGRIIPFYGVYGESLLNAACSAIPQSTCGDLMNGNGIEFTYYSDDPDFRTVEILTQIHDSMEIQIPLSTPLPVHARVLTKIKKSLETPLEFDGRKFVVPADLVVTRCLNKEKGIELKGANFCADPNLLIPKLYESIKAVIPDYEYVA